MTRLVTSLCSPCFNLPYFRLWLHGASAVIWLASLTTLYLSSILPSCSVRTLPPELLLESVIARRRLSNGYLLSELNPLAGSGVAKMVVVV